MPEIEKFGNFTIGVKMTVCNLNITSEVQVFQIVTAIPTFVLGVFVNVSVLVFFWRQRRNCSDMMVYLANISLADSTVLVSLPFRMFSYKNPWPFSLSSCLVFVSTYFVNMYVSIFTTMAISVIRFIAVRYPFKAQAVTATWKAVGVCVGIWVVIGCLSATFHNVDYPTDNSSLSDFRCFQKNSHKPLPLSFVLTLFLIGYLTPFVIIVSCSVTVIRTLSTRTDSHGAPKKSKSVRIIAANLTVFIVCFSPLHFGYLFKFLTETHWPNNCGLQQFAHSFVHVANSLASFNCFLDAFSYYFLAKGSWGSVKEAFCGTQRIDGQSTVI